MKNRSPSLVLFVALLVGWTSNGFAAAKAKRGAAAPLSLDAGWNLQSSAKVPEKGDVLSTAAYKPKGWHTVTAPATVVAALVADKTYPEDPYFGMNIRKLPGMGYDVATNFSNFPMPKDSPFAVSWWYRKQFALPAGMVGKGKNVWLKFEGINYRANIWVNGKRLSEASENPGPWRQHELNVTEVVKAGNNVVAVEVFAQTETDLGITFVDWNPLPPDKNLGLWRGVKVSASGPVALRNPAVFTKLAPAGKDGTIDRADLTVAVVLKNGSNRPVKGVLKGRIGKIAFKQDVSLGASERKEVLFEPEKFAQLKVANPRLWWPAQMGEPVMQELELELDIAGKASDRSTLAFGIREITSELDANKSRVFSVNGKRILIRGAGWSSDMMLREDADRVEQELRYVQDMGLNTVRLEGKLASEDFLAFTDRQGILVMAGWCCCDFWEEWPKWKAADHTISAEQTRDELYRLRSHPSLLAWLNSSDNPPPRKVEERYLQVATETRWPNPVLSSASAKPAELSGVSGVKMLGPYEWVPPKYWLEDTRKGGAYGFNSETSAGPAVPPIESLRKMFPPDKLWPINEHWNFHAGGQEFKQMNIFVQALNKRHGEAKSAEDFAMKSQLMTYEGVRAMFEAYSRNKYQATGVIQWMLNNAWPGLIWHLYDFYLRPGGGYFGTKNALEPVHPMYSYNDGSIWVVNSRYQHVGGLKLTAKVYNLDMTEKFSREAPVDVAADGVKNMFTLPVIEDIDPTHFLRLVLQDDAGKVVGSSFYWLSKQRETLNYDKAEWFVTPTKALGDFTALDKLPKVTLESKNRSETAGEWTTTRVTLKNPSKSLAFFVRLKVNKGAGGEEVLPVMWQDNYVSLIPGEEREISARYRTKDLGGARPAVEISGFNVEAPGSVATSR